MSYGGDAYAGAPYAGSGEEDSGPITLDASVEAISVVRTHIVSTATPTKIASVKATTVVAPTIAAYQTFIPPAPVPGLTGLHDYEVIVVDKYGVAFGQIPSAVPTEIEKVLNDLGESLIDCWILDPMLLELLPMNMIPGAREIQIWRDQECIWWGWPTSATFDAKQVHLTCAGLLYPFSRRNFGPVLVNYLKNPQFEQPAPGGPGDVPGWTVSGVSAWPINSVNPWGAPILLGSQAILLQQADAGVDTYIEQNIAVDTTAPGDIGLFFDLSAWCYIMPGTYGDALDQRGLFVQLVVGGVSIDVEVATITVDTGQGNWVRLETGIDVPPGISGTLNVRLYAPQGLTVWDATNLSVEESRGSAPNGSDVRTIMEIIVTYASQANDDPTGARRPSYNTAKSELATPTTGPLTGTNLIRVYQFSDNSGILDALNEFPTIGVCDFEVTWDATGHFRQFQVFPPAKGLIKYNYALEIDLGAITDLEGSVDGTQTTTASSFLGQGSSGSSEDIGYAAFPSFLGGKTCVDGFIAQGSNTVTATLDFTDDDIGKPIYCLTPGVIPIASTIDTVISSTQCTFVNPSGSGALLAVPFGSVGIFGVDGVILEDVQSALNDLPISTLLGSAQGYLQRMLQASFVPSARQRADGPDGLFGVVDTGDVLPVMFNYGWVTLGPVLMRVASWTLYPPTEEIVFQFNNQPAGPESTY
jgi:hypothetical protein